VAIGIPIGYRGFAADQAGLFARFGKIGKISRKRLRHLSARIADVPVPARGYGVCAGLLSKGGVARETYAPIEGAEDSPALLTAARPTEKLRNGRFLLTRLCPSRRFTQTQMQVLGWCPRTARTAVLL